MERSVEYTIQKLANLAKVSVRTLHHYDQIGLLSPMNRTDAGYRIYGENELLKLQQILFYRELGLPLDEIRIILSRSGFDLIDALKNHKRELKVRGSKINELIKTIDKTILFIKKKNMVKDEDLYKGFSKEQVKEYKKEVREKYDPKIVAESNRRVKAMTKEQWKKMGEESGEVISSLVELMDKDPSDKEVQALVSRHCKGMNNFYDVTPEIYSGLSDLYIQDSRFTAFYDKYKVGLAKFLSDGMKYYVKHNWGK